MSPIKRRLVPTALAAFALAVGAASVAAQAPGSIPTAPAPGIPGSTAATLLNCNPAIEQASRSATFAGQMTSLPDASKMEIRFQLQQRVPGDGGFHALAAPGFGVWRRSELGVQIFRYVKQVTNLPAPAAFRALVGFRWLNARGRVVQGATRLTAVCQQPDDRPLLVVGGVHITAVADQPGEAEYAIAVHNDGRGPAAPFAVTLTVNGSPVADLSVPGLAAATRTVLRTDAAACDPGTSVQVTLDPQRQLSEAPGGGLPATVACPFAAGSSGNGSGSSSGSTGATGATGTAGASGP